MKLTFILAAIVIAAAFSKAEFSNNIYVNGIYADSSLKCPVTGDEINGDHLSLRYIDKDIKFCNEGCQMAFKKEPAKFTDHLLCMPCNDPDGKHDINTVYNGVKYYFCSAGCKGKFEKEPDSYLQKFMK